MNDAEKQKKLLRMMEKEQNQILGIPAGKKKLCIFSHQYLILPQTSLDAQTVGGK
jgi:hypothetical protein